ncbi:hypothetical protein I3842_15G092700 [Carya illinoinensis]|uniref:Uncharacterized protein n=1 Tax=Carya illinoinensis TaxID=32201 RepID=A0A922DAZ0_CARIL|nr:hypothetical protein I3842_15G092700 [Carya illinoinensis]
MSQKKRRIPLGALRWHWAHVDDVWVLMCWAWTGLCGPLTNLVWLYGVCAHGHGGEQ